MKKCIYSKDGEPCDFCRAQCPKCKGEGYGINLIMGEKEKERKLVYCDCELGRKLKEEFDTYYPYRKYETMATYIIPFTAFFRMSYRLVEMVSFLNRNDNTTMVDFMIYKYQRDIELARNKSK